MTRRAEGKIQKWKENKAIFIFLYKYAFTLLLNPFFYFAVFYLSTDHYITIALSAKDLPHEK